MLGQGLISAIQEGHAPAAQLPMEMVIEAMGHSILLGLVLVLATFWVGRTLDQRPLGSTQSEDHQKDIIGSMNLMFLTVGLCGIMILINNSIFRAFAIIAAIALVRFRVKLDNKALGSAMIFAILAGMSCGVHEIGFGYLSVAIYLILTVILMATVRFVKEFQIESAPQGLHPIENAAVLSSSTSGAATTAALIGPSPESTRLELSKAGVQV